MKKRGHRGNKTFPENVGPGEDIDNVQTAAKRREPSINVAEIMKLIEREASQKRDRATKQMRVGADDRGRLTREPWAVAAKTLILRIAKATGTEDALGWLVVRLRKRAPLRTRKRIRVQDLLQYDDREFIKAAYSHLLGREPDAEGLRVHLSSLRNLVYNKIEILHELRSSPEGSENGVAVAGLRGRYAFCRMVKALARIPGAGRPIELMRTLEKARPYLKYLPTVMETSLQAVDALRGDVATRFHNIEGTLQMKAEGRSVTALEDSVREMYGRSLSMDHRLRAADKETRAVSERLNDTEERINDIAAERRLPDDLYLNFENRFRGSRETIKERLAVYLPYMERTGAGAQDRPILDTGCGRGEWLELVSEAGLNARGVDSSQSMVRLCCDRGLAVTCGDAIGHLRQEASDSLGAITGFHIVEHLRPAWIVDLFAQALRTLRPGGIAIFETPNPMNLIVGVCNFYLDLTHWRPIPPAALSFLMEAAGFRDVEILALHPYEGFEPPCKDMSDSGRMLFQGPQDYAVIGYKKP